jgi:CyaY protein
MDEKRYLDLAHDAFERVRAAFDDVDVEEADLESAGDVLTITCRDGVRIVLNTQRPTRELWLAGAARAWHFGWDDASSRWLDPKHEGAELTATLGELVRTHAGVELRLG